LLTDHVRYLSETIGPRPSASDSEKHAAEYVRDRLADFGCETAIEHFPALRTYSWLHILHFSMVIAAWAAMKNFPIASLIVSAAALVSYVLETSSIDLLSRFFPGRISSNAIGFRIPRRPSLAKVVICAHIDSSRSALFFHPALVKNFRATYVLTLTAMILTVAASAVFIAGPGTQWLWIASGIVNLQVLAAALMLIDREIRGRHTPGAVDNASGVAAMLGAAEKLAGVQLDYTEIEFVGTGSEESGLFGIKHHIEKNWHDKDRTYIINIDHVGTGNIAVATREGMILRRSANPDLVADAMEFKLSSTGSPPAKKDFRTMLTDGYAALMRGYMAMSVMSFKDDGGLANWHWHTDVAENISEDNLRDASDLAAHLVMCIEEHSKEANRELIETYG